MVNHLNKGLQVRQEKIEDVKKYLQETQRLFNEFGQQELVHVTHKFEDIEKSLNSSGEVKLVVIGEFSRGKSTLVNALLDILLLRSAQEATTAINTFVRKLPEDITQRFIRIHFQDNRQPQDIEWQEGDYSTLEKWSTELDTTNASARQQIDRIEIFMSHPLLNQGLVLIDTPGLQSVVAHHEGITRRAIDEAHIAIWVQSTQQLGGNATEWKFLSGTIRKNFNKFLTVVNMWDSVLEPQDPFDRQKPLAEREQQKYQHIRQNFKTNLSDISDAEIMQMTNEDNLIGVSAIWALEQEDANKHQRSNIGKLSQRISDMLSTGEALDEIYKKPLHSLVTIQEDLIASIQEELSQLDSNQSLAERQRESEALDSEIRLLNMELETTNKNAKGEHDRAAEQLVKGLEKELISPLTDLKTDIDGQVTTQYIKREVDKGNQSIQLPKLLQQQYDEALEQVDAKMQQHNENIVAVLSDLRADYVEQLEQHAGQLQQKIGNIKFELPKLDLDFEIDLSEIHQYMQEQARLEDKIAQHQQEIERLEQEQINNAENPAAMESAKRAVRRAESELERLGGRPSPKAVSKTRYESHGGMGFKDFFLGKKEVHYTEYDDSNGEAWEEAYDAASEGIADKEAYMERIQREEHEKTGKRLNAARLQQKYDQKVRKLEQDRKRMEQQAQVSKDQLIEDTRQQLIRNTSGTLDKFIRQLQTQVQPSIGEIFNEQLQLLQQQVKEQLEEPLQAKQAQRQQIEELIAQGQEQIKLRHAALEQGLQDVQGLCAATQDLLSANV